MENMLSEALREFTGLLEQLIRNLLGNDAKEWTEEFKKFLRKEPCWPLPKLLRKITAVPVSGTKKFVVKDALKDANVGWTGDNFTKHFLNKVEKNVEGVAVAVHSLERSSLDAPIMAELGIRVESKLCYLFDMLKKQSKGENGPLLTNGYANIIYVMGGDGNLWAVNANWGSDNRYWNVGANSVGHPYRWGDGDQVLSRDS